MVVHVKLLGCANRPTVGLSRWFYIYFLEAVNGAVATEESEDYLEDGDYELPDKDWTYNENEDYGEDLIDEKDLFCSTPA
jgi:hypothetical protein